jgi:hypothetical protein
MKFNVLKLALSLGAVALMSSCSLDDDNSNYTQPLENVAYGIITNASPNSGSLFFSADENRVNNTALNYTDAEGYYRFRLGDRVLSLKDQAGTVLDTAHVTLAAGDYFSAFAVNTFNNIELVTYKDSLEYPEQNRALVRFINLSPDSGAINVTGLTQTFATDLSFKEATEFISVPTGSYELRYADTQSGAALHTDTGVEFIAGRIYTIYTKGYVAPPTGSNDIFSTERLRNL